MSTAAVSINQQLTKRLRSAEAASFPRHLGSQIKDLNLMLLGSCQVEHLTLSALRLGHKTSHFLYYGQPWCEVPTTGPEDYDAAIVGLTLRALLYEATGHAPDVAHARDTWTAKFAQEALVRLEDNLRDRVSRIRTGVTGVPLFFLSFIEPSFNYEGMLIYDESPRNLSVFMREANAALRRVLHEFSSCYYLDLNAAINMVGRAHLFEDSLNAFSHNSTLSVWGDHLDTNRIVTPTSVEDMFDIHPNINLLHEVVLEQLSDALKILRRTDAVKLIILDLDDTLWRGIAAEESLDDETRTGGWPLGLVEALLYFKRRGGLLAICSKNDEAPTRERFVSIWQDRLKLDDFVSVKINWKPKSENIAETLEELNLLPDNVVFVDDNPREIDEVKSNFPELRCLGGNHRDWRRIILQAPEMQVAEITQESLRRTDMTKAGIDRTASSKNMNREEWLRSLELEQEITLVRSDGDALFPRTLELLNKTNQFNTTGKRWSQEDLNTFFCEGGRALVTSLRDKAVDNGIVGICLVNGPEIVQTVLSCRVFGLGAEIALGSVGTAVALASAPHAKAVTVDTGRNAVSRDYFSRLGFDGRDGCYETNVACDWPSWIKVSVSPSLAEFTSAAAETVEL